MRYPAIILTLLLSSSVGLTAQTMTHSTSAILTSGPSSESCPVGFSASRVAAPTMMVTKGAEPGHSSLGLQLNFSRLAASQIVKASITVHGPSEKARVAPASTKADTNMTETFELRSDAQAKSLLHAAVWMKKMGAVKWVNLTEIEYANGSVWHASSNSKCRAVPNYVLLVASAQ
jgi:hypothetical protein